ncbi:MAG: type II CRISPR-associated endonuclease Cas1 [Bacteroidia bacterium]|nr:type II CRISPR-associated endonuclease Cas1 [Bacteroidia bacterium]
MKRTIVISQPCRINISNDQLVCAKSDESTLSVSFEDLGILLLETSQYIITGAALSRLMEAKVAVITCTDNHHPNGLLLPLAGGGTHTEVLRTQVEASQPLRKQLWKVTVKAKISNQAVFSKQWGDHADPLFRWSKKVRSGDPDNYEARAASWYWKRFLGKTQKFLRDPEGDPPNSLLNYGYAILRAAMARAVVSSGLHPSLGIHHRNRYNPFCLADDLMEPYRPFVDSIVRGLYFEQGEHYLSRDAKAALLSVLTADVLIAGNRRPLLLAMSMSSSSLAECYAEKSASLTFPTPHEN